MIEKVTRMNDLYDVYGSLLTPKQKDYFEQYYHEDLSLSEIAENCGISRPAVFDNIKRTQNLLESYEGKLKLLEKQAARLNLLEQLQKMDDLSQIKRQIGALLALEEID